MKRSRELIGHSNSITHITSSENLISTCSDDGTVRLWDLRSSHAIRCLILSGGSTTSPSCSCFNSSCDTLFVSYGKEIGSLDLRNSSIVIRASSEDTSTNHFWKRIFKDEEEEINEINLQKQSTTDSTTTTTSPLLLATNDSGDITVLNPTTGIIKRNLHGQHSNICSSAKWHSPTRKDLIVSCGLDGFVVEWDISKGRACLCKQSLIKNSQNNNGNQMINPPICHCLDISNDGKSISVALGDGTIALLSSNKLKQQGVLQGSHNSSVSSVCFLKTQPNAAATSSKTSLLVSGGNDSILSLWNVSNLESPLLDRVESSIGKVNWISQCNIIVGNSSSPSSDFLVSGSSNNGIVLSITS